MSELNQGCCAGHADGASQGAGAGQAAEHGCCAGHADGAGQGAKHDCCAHEAAGAAGAGAAKPAFVADGVNVAVVGATGQVGRVMCAMLDQRDFPVKSLRLFSSARSAGSVVTWRGQDITVEDVAKADLSGIDVAILAPALPLHASTLPSLRPPALWWWITLRLGVRTRRCRW